MFLGTGFGSRFTFRIALIGMILTLCLCVSSWGACRSVPCGEWKGGASGCGQYGYCSNTMSLYCVCNNVSVIYNGSTSGTLAISQFGGSAGSGVKYCFTTGPIAMNNNVSNDPIYICDTQAEADSVYCEMNPSDPSCIPQIDSTACDTYRQECESYGGKFTGNPVTSDVSETGCLSFCDMCNSKAQNNYRRSRAILCCADNKVPPLEITSCQNLELTGSPDMSFSSFDCDNQGGYDCDCKDTITSENAHIFNSVCNENQWEDPNPSEGGEGSESSSSAEENPDSGSSGSGEDWEYDYRDSLKRIIKYDSLTLETNRAILTCLLSPSACGNSSENSSPDYSGSLTDIKTDIKKLDTTVNNSINSLKGSISDGNDSLIDSIRKFISMNSFSFSGDTLGDSLGKIHGTLSNIFGLLNGNGTTPDLNQDYGGFGSAELDGKNLADSVRGTIGFDGLDSINIDGRFQAGLDSANSGSFEIDSVDFQNLHDSLGNALVNQVNSDRDHLPDTLNKYADSLISVAPFTMFDSLIYSTLGNRIPNTNECPDGCFKWSLNLPRFGLINYTVDYGVCLGRVPLGGMNALSFIRLIVRLFVVVACIWIVVWNFTRKKG